MSNLGSVNEEASSDLDRNILAPRQVKLTTRSAIEINRLLPHKGIRRIGAWVFFDHFGPTEQTTAMQVGAHPHTGLQTVSWLFSGKVLHHDSVGSKQIIEPSQLNLMTAGQGVAHSEMSLSTHQLHAIQLWTCLPESHRNTKPTFEHFAELPAIHSANFDAKVIMGRFLNVTSPATIYTPLVAVEITLKDDALLQLEETYEHGIFAVESDLFIDGHPLLTGHLYYLEAGRKSIKLEVLKPTTIFLIGGEPFTEPIVMWWNFIGRSHEEITEMHSAWNSQSSLYPEFHDELNLRIPAPPMPAVSLKPSTGYIRL